MKYDVIIIGGGLAGLSAGALLARQGRRVLILEKEKQAGGRAAPVEQDGFVTGAGPSFSLYTSESPHARILSVLGGSIPSVETRGPWCWIDRGGRLMPHPFPGSPTSLFGATLPSFSARLTMRSLHKRIMAMRPEEAWDIPLHIWLNSYCTDEAVQRFLNDTTQLLHFNADREGLSTGYFIERYQAAVRAGSVSRFMPTTGWKPYMEVCRSVIEKTGGQVRTGTAVNRIELSDSAVLAVHLDDGEVLKAPVYVVACPVQRVRSMIDLALESVKFKVAQWTRLESTMGVALDLGVEGANAGEQSLISIPEDRILIACPSAWDTTVAPSGMCLFKAIRLLTPKEIGDEAILAESRRLLLERIDRHSPGASSRSVLKHFETHAMLTGARHRQGQSTPHLVPFRIPELRNLFFAGDTTAGAGELADVAFNSALRVSELVAGFLTQIRTGAA